MNQEVSGGNMLGASSLTGDLFRVAVLGLHLCHLLRKLGGRKGKLFRARPEYGRGVGGMWPGKRSS